MNEFPSKGSIVARHQRGNKSFRFFVKVFNRIVSFLYRIKFLPLFGISKRIIIIETIGRKTKKRRFNPVLYYRYYTGVITVYSARGKQSNWIKNILASPDGTFVVYQGFKKYRARMVFVDDPEEKYKHLRYFCENYRSAKNVFGYTSKHKKILDSRRFREFAEKKIEFVQIIPIKQHRQSPHKIK